MSNTPPTTPPPPAPQGEIYQYPLQNALFILDFSHHHLPLTSPTPFLTRPSLLH